MFVEQPRLYHVFQKAHSKITGQVHVLPPPGCEPYWPKAVPSMAAPGRRDKTSQAMVKQHRDRFMQDPHIN